MKKLIPLLLALILLLSLSMIAFADGEGNSHTYDPDDSTKMNQTVTTTIPDNKILWHLEIPADVTITEGGYEGRKDIGNVRIVLENGELSDTQKIQATLTYDGIMSLEEDVDVKLVYSLSDKAAVFNGNDYDTLDTGVEYVVGTMTKKDTTYNSPNAWVGSGVWDAAQSGNYAGTVVYSSTLIESGE